MNNKVKSIVVALALAVIAFFLPLGISANLALAIGIILGAVINLVLSANTSSGSSSTDSKGKESSNYKGDTKTLYVGNLPYRANEAAVRELFSSHGTVVSVRLMRDRNTGKRKGFGFVEIAAKDADGAIAALNDADFQQRTLKVREAKERPAPQDKKELVTE